MTIQPNGRTETKDTLDFSLCVLCANRIICKFSTVTCFNSYGYHVERADPYRQILKCSEYIEGNANLKSITFQWAK